jgi:PepB aminopeptidase
MSKYKIKLQKNKTSTEISPLLSFSAHGANINLTKRNSIYPLRQIQAAARQCSQIGMHEVELTDQWTLEEQWAFYQGFSKPKNPGNIKFASLNPKDSTTLQHRIKVIEWVKYHNNMGASACTPLRLCHAAENFIKEIAANKYKITTEYFAGEELLHHGYVGCYNVGRGSVNPPVLLSIKVMPKNKTKASTKAVLVGKGITFDSGGYMLKPTNNIHYMKADMSGAATVTGALALVMLQGLNEPVELILCCAENMISGNAYKPGDILEYKNGVKVEILNTDAEGRLVLADGLIRADATNAPLIIDAATLTGAAQIAVGKDFCALFSLDQKLRERTLKYAETMHEGLWPLPLELWHRDMLPSFITDTANAQISGTGSPGGPSTAAGFLSRFLTNPQQGWLHFDLSNAYMPEPNALWSGGATGNMIITIAETLLQEISAAA